jgi:Tol biopolymer transport system component
MKNMKNISTVLFCGILMASLLGCVVDINQPVNMPSNVEITPVISRTIDPNITTVPITWADLHLSGRLVYNTASSEGDVFTSKIHMLDLKAGEIKTIFTVTGTAWIYYLTVSPDVQQVIMSYAPTSDSSTGLYILPLDENATPQILLAAPTTHDRYTQVEWSSDGKYIYFVHYNFQDQPANQIYPNYQVFRMAYPNGKPEKILEHAVWLRDSSDSSRIVYVSFDPVSGFNQLFLANADGSDPQAIVINGPLASEILDAPIFSPDGQAILFSAASPAQAYQLNWLDRLMGVQVASAHSVPSDWWSVPLTGGIPTRLTHLQAFKLFASLSPDKQHVASLSGDGIFVMDVDGSNLTQLLNDPKVSSTLNWIP